MAATRPPRATLAVACVAAGLVCALAGCADPRVGSVLDEVLRSATGSGSGGAPDRATIAAGLREALRVGSERAVAATSRRDGFLGNALIRIAVPDELDSAATALRRVGLGSQVDALEVSMNRAAEQASGEAFDVFAGAIRGMTLEDVVGVWRGGDTAATAYFREHTQDALRARFEPIVATSMQRVGLARLYGDLVARVRALPLVEAPTLDLEDYVTDRTLDGLFTVLGQEETRIRQDPAARTTELLREVFGSAR